MSLQNYEIGSRVATPLGEGMIVKYNRSTRVVTVHTDTHQQPYTIEELEGYAAGALDINSLEQWLDAPAPTMEATNLRTESVACSCPCGVAGGCYDNVRGGAKIMHFANGDCRCREGNCSCVG